MGGARKYRRSRVLHKVLNPGALTRLRLTNTRRYALLETTGRRTGTPRRTPVSYEQDGSTVWIVAIHGAKADYVKNLRAEPNVRVRIGGVWHAARAEVVEDDDVEARAAMWSGSDRIFGRLFWNEPLTIKVVLLEGAE